MLELFKNVAKIRKLFDEGSYLQAAALVAKTVAAMLGEFNEGEGGVPMMRAKRTKVADVKNLEKAEAVLAEIEQAPRGAVGDATGAGGAGLAIFLQLLPILIEWVRRRREQG